MIKIWLKIFWFMSFSKIFCYSWHSCWLSDNCCKSMNSIHSQNYSFYLLRFWKNLGFHSLGQFTKIKVDLVTLSDTIKELFLVKWKDMFQQTNLMNLSTQYFKVLNTIID